MVLLMSLSFVQPIVIDSFSCHFFRYSFRAQFICVYFFIFCFPFGTFFVVVTVNGNLQLGLDWTNTKYVTFGGLFFALRSCSEKWSRNNRRRAKKGFHGDARFTYPTTKNTCFVNNLWKKLRNFHTFLSILYQTDWYEHWAWVGSFSRLVSLCIRSFVSNCIRINESAII